MPMIQKTGVSPTIASMLLCVVTPAGVTLLYPFVSSAMSGPVYSVTVLSASLVRQDSYITLTLNVKNTGSAPVKLNCTRYNDNSVQYGASRVLYLWVLALQTVLFSRARRPAPTSRWAASAR